MLRLGRPPPLEAYGALLAEYARQRDADAALAVLQEFFERGGTPDDQMFDTVMDLCMRTGEFRRAMQVCWPPLRIAPHVHSLADRKVVHIVCEAGISVWLSLHAQQYRCST